MIRRNLQSYLCLTLMPAFLLIACPIASAQITIGGGMTKRKPVDFNDRVVTFPSLDGVMIEADYYPIKVPDEKKTPVAILIHMYPLDRASWKELVPQLRKAGIAVLAYDIRGTGGSIKPESRKLEAGYKNRDADHFTNAWMDVAGARNWLEQQRNIDVQKLAIIGASIGCSISLDYTHRMQDSKAVVCLSPGTNYMGLDSRMHIQACSTVPILLISPEEEYEAVKELVEASGGKAKSKKYPGGADHHGTRMFQADYGKKVEKKIMKFVKKHLDIKTSKSEDEEKKGEKKKKKKKTKKKKKKKKDAKSDD